MYTIPSKRCLLEGLGRDPERAPMQWQATANSGFCPRTPPHALPVADDCTEVNVTAQRQDPRSMLSMTRNLLAPRRKASAISAGGYGTVHDYDDECFVFLHRRDDDEYLVTLKIFQPTTESCD
jgi:alpha-glucosidase